VLKKAVKAENIYLYTQSANEISQIKKKK